MEIVRRPASRKKNAWILDLSDTAKLVCGVNVEVKLPNAFFEGAWFGSFAEFDFAASAEVFGSGAVLTDDGWLLVPPTHTMEAIYALQKPAGEWIASNSLAFIKKYSSFKFRIANDALLEAFIGVANGIKNRPTGVRTSEGSLFVLHHYNALLTSRGLQPRPKAAPPTFEKFADYSDYLNDVVSSVVANANAGSRAATYQPLATISSGYDSPVGAVLARKVGATEAVTITKARSGESDDGTPMGTKLGLTVSKYERPTTIEDDRGFVAEMFSTGTQGEDIVYQPLRGKLSQKILFTGFHGDKIWDKNTTGTAYIKRGDISGASLNEFRLSESFIHLPVPFIGVSRHPDLTRIANSEEMKPYSVGGSYDRPIPRRIIESAGIDRDAFGQTKKAIVVLAFLNKSELPERIRNEVEGRLKTLPTSRQIAYLMGSARFRLERFLLQLPYLLASTLKVDQFRHLSKIVVPIVFRRRSGTMWEHSDPFNGLVLDWALDVVADEYPARFPQSNSSKKPPLG